MGDRAPIRFCSWTFLWSWIVWVPLVLAGFGAVPLDPDLRARLTMPALVLGAFGAAFGACMAIGTLHGRAALTGCVGRFASLRLGWRSWTATRTSWSPACRARRCAG
jgi:hypothetical protein